MGKHDDSLIFEAYIGPGAFRMDSGEPKDPVMREELEWQAKEFGAQAAVNLIGLEEDGVVPTPEDLREFLPGWWASLKKDWDFYLRLRLKPYNQANPGQYERWLKKQMKEWFAHYSKQDGLHYIDQEWLNVIDRWPIPQVTNEAFNPGPSFTNRDKGEPDDKVKMFLKDHINDFLCYIENSWENHDLDGLEWTSEAIKDNLHWWWEDKMTNNIRAVEHMSYHLTWTKLMLKRALRESLYADYIEPEWFKIIDKYDFTEGMHEESAAFGPGWPSRSTQARPNEEQTDLIKRWWVNVTLMLTDMLENVDSITPDIVMHASLRVPNILKFDWYDYLDAIKEYALRSMKHDGIGIDVKDCEQNALAWTRSDVEAVAGFFERVRNQGRVPKRADINIL